MKDVNLKIDSLSAFFLFRGLDGDALRKIDEQLSPAVCYERGERIYDTHTFDRSLGMVLSGTVLVQSPEEQGRPLIMNRLCAGDVFGAAALFDDKQDDYVTDLTTLTPVCVRFITQEQMTALFAAFPQTSQNYIAFLSGRIRFLNRKLAALTGGSSVSRLYHYCLSHQDEHGTVALPRSMTELSRTLNMGRSSLYRALDTLLQQGIVTKDGKQYTIIH